jgi:P4 family phage/plasmid primase-like protien
MNQRNNPITLDTFLRNNKSPNKQLTTHTRIPDKSIGLYGGAFNISDESTKEFNKLYWKSVIINNKLEYLTERQLIEKGPILIDIDERYATTIREHPGDRLAGPRDGWHDDSLIEDLINLYVEEILSMLIIPPDGMSFNIYVMEKDKMNVLCDKVKDGLHIIIGLTMSHKGQMLLRRKILGEICQIFEHTGLTTTYEQLLDEGITKGTTNWQVYGSRKPGHDSYHLYKWYNVCVSNKSKFNKTLVEICDPIPFKLFVDMSARNMTHVEYDMNPNTITELTKCIPKHNTTNHILACGEHVQTLKIKEVAMFANIHTQQECQSICDTIMASCKTNKDYDPIMAHQFVNLLTPEYFSNYDKWIKVGWTLKTISESLYPTWLLFSSKWSNFKWGEQDIECWDAWNQKMSREGNTMGSLRYWAKQCNPTEYATIRKNTTGQYFVRILENDTEYDYAKVVHMLLCDNYICCSIKERSWFEFIQHRWVACDSGTTLRHALSCKISQYFHKAISKMVYSNDGNDEQVKKENTCMIAKATQSALKLKKTAWKNNVMRECQELFYDGNFKDKLDTNIDLLCFNNKVYDYAIRGPREGKPDDYLTLCTNTDYVPLDLSNPTHVSIKQEILTFMEQLFPHEAVRNYMWDHLASVLRGNNMNQTFNIYTGTGRNGKSKLVELMSLVLGDYKGSVPLALITKDRGVIGAASPEVAQLKGLRYAVMQEPSKNTKLNEGIMKELTGGDPIQGRSLYQNTVTFVPQFSLVVCTNHLFDISSSDDGTWRRIRVCDFISRFVDNPSPVKEDYEFQVDRQIDKKFKKWVPILTAMLLERLEQTNGICRDCDEVMSASLEYKGQQDYFTAFLTERLVKEDGSRLRKTDVKTVFEEWYKELHNDKPPKGKELYAFLDKHLGKSKKAGWINWKVNMDEWD